MEKATPRKTTRKKVSASSVSASPKMEMSQNQDMSAPCCDNCGSCSKDCTDCKNCINCDDCQHPLRKMNWTPFLMVMLLIASFLLGALTNKVSELQGGQAPVAPAQQQAGTQGAPQQPAQKVNVTNGRYPLLGNKDAKVTVVEFADFQCPFCEQWYKTVEPQIMKDYVNTGKIKFAFRDYPFLGQESTDAANAASCANEQGKFWDYHNYLYEHQGQENSGTFSKDNLKQFAVTLGLNTTQFNSCVDANKYAADNAADMKDGQAAGVQGTPATFVNGTIIVGAQPYSAFKAAIDAELAKQ